jgi:hypothetical protein
LRKSWHSPRISQANPHGTKSDARGTEDFRYLLDAGASGLLSLFAAFAHDRSERDCRPRGDDHDNDASVQHLHGGERSVHRRYYVRFAVPAEASRSLGADFPSEPGCPSDKHPDPWSWINISVKALNPSTEPSQKQSFFAGIIADLARSKK